MRSLSRRSTARTESTFPDYSSSVRNFSWLSNVVFTDQNGDLLTQFKNKKAEYKNYAYYYSSPADILNSMKEVLKHFDIEVPELKKGEKLKPVKKTKEEKKDKKEEKKEKKEEKKEEL